MIVRDPKFGYHWIWLTPLACIFMFLHGTFVHSNRMINWIQNRYMECRHPELKRLRMLSGIDMKRQEHR